MGCSLSSPSSPTPTGPFIDPSATIPKTPLHPTQYATEQNFVHEENNFPIISPSAGFLVELGTSLSHSDIEATLEGREIYSPYYKEHFHNTEHLNYVGMAGAEPIIISVQFDKTLSQFRVLIRTRKSDYHTTMLPSTSKRKVASHLLSLFPQIPPLRLQHISDSHLPSDLLHLEDRLLIKNYKFGVIYCQRGQSTDDEFFSNQKPSPHFEEFMGLLGDRIALKGWQGFDGELDTKSDTTGTHSIFTRIENFDIMYHVSTMLPYSEVNKQQIERKRHIGNDIVCIIFQDAGSVPFNPASITSKYNHVYIVVQPVTPNVIEDKVNGSFQGDANNTTKYKVAVACKSDVKPFGPLLAEGATYDYGTAFREFLLYKAINAERAAYCAPAFGLYRTRKTWLNDIIQKYNK